MVIIFSVMVGCSENQLEDFSEVSHTWDQQKVKDIIESDKIEKNNIDGIYINVRQKFTDIILNDVDFNGTAYKNNYDNNVLKYLYLNGDTFTNYYEVTPSGMKFYSGTYEIGKEDQLMLNCENISFHNYDNGKKWEYSIYDDPNESRTTAACIERMQNINRYQCMDYIFSPFNINDKVIYMHGPYCKDFLGGDEKNSIMTGSYRYAVRTFYRDNFIIAKQKGYYFDQINSTNEFTLKYDNSIFTTEYDCNMQINFNEDNTYVITSCEEFGGYSGKWELLDDHLLLIHVPDEYEDSLQECYNLLYVDFETKEVAMPLFIRCDDLNLR